MNESVQDVQPLAETSDLTVAESRSAGESNLTPESVVEALLISTDDPLPAGKIAQILGTGTAADVKAHIDTLNERYATAGASYRIECIAKGYQILTLPDYAPWVKKLHKARDDTRLTGAALETLAVIAYKQPVLRADIEAVRGVAAGDLLIRLRDAGLIRIVGRAEEIGRPLLYGTTPKFLEVFGLATLKDLPKLNGDLPAGAASLKPVE